MNQPNPHPNHREILAQLESYLDLGFSPIPLQGKVARYPWKKFTLRTASIPLYIQRGANWGLRTDQLKCGLWFYVLDLDSKSLLSEVIEHCPGLADAPIVSTGHGFHVYCTWTDQFRTNHYDDLSIIGNGYVVAPPSTHPDTGKRYVFIRPLKSIPPIVDPERLIPDEIKTSRSSGDPRHRQPGALLPPLSSLSDLLEHGAPEGQRHNTLVRHLGSLFSCGVSQDEALKIVLEQNERNRPPLPVSEVTYTVKDCYRRFGKRESESETTNKREVMAQRPVQQCMFSDG